MGVEEAEWGKGEGGVWSKDGSGGGRGEGGREVEWGGRREGYGVGMREGDGVEWRGRGKVTEWGGGGGQKVEYVEVGLVREMEWMEGEVGEKDGWVGKGEGIE